MGDDYARAVTNARITLCFLSKLYPDQTTQRTFEIPASGGFMLAERTKEHLSLFGEGREAGYFSGREELLQKIRHYLDHEGKRKRIAVAALRRCRRDGYRYDDRIQQAIDLVFKKTKNFQKGKSS